LTVGSLLDLRGIQARGFGDIAVSHGGSGRAVGGMTMLAVVAV
jgi:hypothetical protein